MFCFFTVLYNSRRIVKKILALIRGNVVIRPDVHTEKDSGKKSRAEDNGYICNKVL